jgi:cytochrome oxidase Cu insertion factor (SCO1/SenC/PrrC family)
MHGTLKTCRHNGRGHIMYRYCAFAIVALLPAALGADQAGGKEEIVTKIQGKLTKDDPKDKKTNSASQAHIVNMKAGYQYTIDMVSNELDSYLRLEDNKGKQLDEDDDSGGNLNARIVFNCPADGDYKVICTALGAEGGGNYALTVKKSASTVKTSTAHDVLLGKAAPDFKGDFALNGQVVRLSALKGKVVLVQFWDARSDACVATIARLSKWSKEFKGAGLEVVAVTFYNYEIGQKLAFDKDAGRLARVETADKQTEQAALKEFAAYHKLDHLVMTLPREDAMRAFDAYAVNGVPQAVLIDRKGIIRAIRFDDEKSAKDLEAEVKKLLAEK